MKLLGILLHSETTTQFDWDFIAFWKNHRNWLRFCAQAENTCENDLNDLFYIKHLVYFIFVIAAS